MDHLLTVHDLSCQEVAEILDLSARVKAEPQRFAESLKGKTLGMVFQKSSTRTRVSFEVGMFQLGGHGLFLSSNDIQLGRGETIPDTAKVLSRYVDAIMIRTFDHQDVVDLARFGTIPVINGLDDLVHPCQALTDVFTMAEHLGDLAGKKLAYVGDGNNMAHSLMYAGAKTGVSVTVASPAGYAPRSDVVEAAKADAAETGARIEVVADPAEACQDADAVYTDVWASMGQEAEQAQRVKAFQGFQVTAELMARAGPGAIFLHCLPAHRGEEVAADVIDGPQSVVFDEAENRLHVQKAILLKLLS
ncbi:MAG: ornithine carbamoyltransferase [Planctomycetota bacterium]|jgi:ornithine carbamoyltransferase